MASEKSGPEKMQKTKVLLVDDMPGMLKFISRILEKGAGVEVQTAGSGAEAVRIFEAAPEGYFALILSDIEMPEMNGFETLRRIKEIRPGQRVAMISGAPIDDYLAEATAGRITNIISKEDPPSEIVGEFKKLVTGRRVFGIRNYLEPGSKTIRERLRNYPDVSNLVKKVCEEARQYMDKEKKESIYVGLMELISNAFYHAFEHPRDMVVTALDENEKVFLEYGHDSQKLAVAVIDLSGRLSHKNVLEAMGRWSHPTQADMYRSDGRGFLIVRSLLDQMIINIRPNKKTETILINFFNRQYKVSKPLVIHEL